MIEDVLAALVTQLKRQNDLTERLFDLRDQGLLQEPKANIEASIGQQEHFSLHKRDGKGSDEPFLEAQRTGREERADLRKGQSLGPFRICVRLQDIEP